MKNSFSIKINKSLLEKSAQKVIEDLIVENPKITSLENAQNLWDIVKSIDLNEFFLLRENAFFSNLLRSIEYKKNSHSSVMKSPDYKVLDYFDEQKLMLNNQVQIETPVSKKDLEKTTADKVKLSSINSEVEEPENMMLPSPCTPLDNIVLPARFLKLIKRLRSISKSGFGFNIGNTLNDIINISDEVFYKIPGVGPGYHDVLKELKRVYKEADSFYKVTDITDIEPMDLSNMRLTYSGIDKCHFKSLDKLANYLDTEDLSDEIDFILKLDKEKLGSIPGIGTSAIKSLLIIKDLIKEEITKIQLGDIDFYNFDSKLIIPNDISQLTVERFAELLLEDIDVYLEKLDERGQDIIQKRWSFVEEKQTLEEIGILYGVERERIRQIEKKITDNLPRNLRLSCENIWQMLEPILTPDLPNRLHDLSSCFNSEVEFYEFLSIISDQVNLYNYVQPVIRPNLLNKYFEENGGPVSYDDIKEYLIECDFENVKDVDNAILFLGSKGNIQIKGCEIWPKNLRKSEAVAFVLASYPNGLPWIDIAKYINLKKYSHSIISIDRLDSEAFRSTEFVFLSGKGTYKHTRYIDFSILSPEDIFDEMLIFINSNKREVFHLNECYRISKVLQKQDYYIVRHIVKSYGEEYGFYFSGRSQTDSVGLEKNFKRVTQRDVIIEAMRENIRPITSVQIANLLKSKSNKHASYYLDQMMENGQIVQVDRMLYTTPELAYKNIDLPLYLESIRKVLIEKNKPVESSIFKSLLNDEFSASYSKYFYASIALKYSNEQGWHRKQNLFSIKIIPYKSLSEAVEIHCNLEKSLDQNIAVLNQHIAISSDAASVALSRWRRDAGN